MNNNINPTKYVVLDVETNGLSSLRYDLLSLSLYRPDNDLKYNKFLPLDLNDTIYTTKINGIKKKDLKNATHLTQNDVDELFNKFELPNRTILTYGNIDEKFLRKYFERHHLKRFEELIFYNFKHDIISSKFSEGNITKDNLCKLFNIKGVTSIHSGINDCILEWKLFNSLNGNKLFITNNDVYIFNSDYIIPVSYISNYPNFKYHINDFPKIQCSRQILYSIRINGKTINKFPTNFNGLIIEHQFNSLLNAKKVDSTPFLIENKNKLKYIGTLPSENKVVCSIFNDDGTFTATNDEDTELIEDINLFADMLRKKLAPMISFIKKNIFPNEQITSQELIINKKQNVLALCDLSTNNAVLEIKSNNIDVSKYATQLYFEANGSDCYILNTKWGINTNSITFILSKVSFEVNKPKVRKKNAATKNTSKKHTANPSIVVVKEDDNKVVLQCLNCNKRWTVHKQIAFSDNLICIRCLK